MWGCCNGDEASLWKRPKFYPSPRQNRLTDLYKNWLVLLFDGTHQAKFCSDRFRGFCSPHTWFCRASGFFVRFWSFSIRLQPTPLNGCLHTRQVTSFRVRKCPDFGGSRWLYFIFRPLNLRVKKTAILGTNFDWTLFVPKTTLTRECSRMKVLLIVIVAS